MDKRFLIGAWVLLVSGFLLAQYIPPGPESQNYWPDIVDGQSLSASPCFSWTPGGQSTADSFINVGGYSQLGINMKLTRGSGDGTYAQWRCWAKIYDDSTFYQIQAATASNVDSNTDLKLNYGNKLLYRAIGDNNVGANNEAFEFAASINHQYIKCCAYSDSTTDDVISASVVVSGQR